MASTISLSNEMKENLKNLGRAGESYEDVIRRMYELTKKQIMLTYLYSEDSIPIEKVLREAKQKWPKL